MMICVSVFVFFLILTFFMESSWNLISKKVCSPIFLFKKHRSLKNILWDKIACPHRKPFGLFYPLETCFSSYFFFILYIRVRSILKIIKKSLVKSHLVYFFGYFRMWHITRLYWPTVNQKGKTCFYNDILYFNVNFGQRKLEFPLGTNSPIFKLFKLNKFRSDILNIIFTDIFSHQYIEGQ